ncbi:hypothetical protein RWV98_07780 [Agathobaculum sp. NTUH-O15-33]|uniref:hypothetical protein n=1 Tax=Agathobaculum sp. NTUH-O15-33 TaxID=3079302 RepID=UPI002958A6FB|nr:hypothetical protein [Agathobaculum sp. NTUH-O15-33]WNX86160.1 hypothetical protein RWV98_07780 [Agathobaculum sp. NTUH-O15-33]
MLILFPIGGILADRNRTYLPFYLAALIMLVIGALTRPIFHGMGQLKNANQAQSVTF